MTDVLFLFDNNFVGSAPSPASAMLEVECRATLIGVEHLVTCSFLIGS